MTRFKIISSEVIHQNPWWTYKHDVYTRLDGRPGEHYYGEKRQPVLIVPVFPDGRLVLIKQYRYLWDAWHIEFPAGHSEPGESSADTAARELLEETGFAAEELIKIGQFCIPSFKGSIPVFLAGGLKAVSSPAFDPTEEIELLYRRVDEVGDMVRGGEFSGATSLAAWALVRDRLK